MNRTLLTLLAVCSYLSVNGQDSGTGHAPYASLKAALLSERELSGSSGPVNLNWIDQGNRFSYTYRLDGHEEIRLFDPKTVKDEAIFDTKGITFPGESRQFNYTSFQWSKDSKFILFQTNFRQVWRRSGTSDFYLYSLANRSLKLVAKDARTAELSPDGAKVGYERDGDLFVYDLAGAEEKQLTSNAGQYFYNGRFGWVYEEEFGLAQAWVWSPDSKYIAFWQTDERQVPLFKMTDYAGQHVQYVDVPYPKVGDPIPDVKIGVINIATGKSKWMDIATDQGYIPRIYWTSNPGTLGIVHLNRKQNHLKLLFFDAETGTGKTIMEESSKQWIDLMDFAGNMHFFFFPDNTKEFFWISDRDGWSHIYRYDYEGHLINQVTSGKWEVSKLEAIDVKTSQIYYTSTEASPLERNLYVIDFKGAHKTRLTDKTGTHTINISPTGNYYLDAYSNVNTPKQVELWSGQHKLIKVFEENKKVGQFISSHFYAPKELFSFTTGDGQLLEGYVIKPKDFDPNKKYPLIMDIYGGPGSEFVTNTFGTNGWQQYMAQSGYVIVNVNNRGSGGYGRDFEKIVYKNMGKYQSQDFVETARYFASKPWIDGSNMAIKGTSFGGFMSSFTMLTFPGVFKVAIVGAPVTDWMLYDAVYTERFMDVFEDNKEGYRINSSVANAAALKGHMFIGHSAMDDNVHLQNTMQLVKALIDAGKDADLRIYPPGGHQVSYNTVSRTLLAAQQVDYLNKYLKGDFQSNEVGLVAQ